MQESLQGVDMEVTWQRILDLQIFFAVWAGGVRWKGDVKMLRHIHCQFSSAVSPSAVSPASIWQLPGICYAPKVNGPQVFLPKSIWLFFM